MNYIKIYAPDVVNGKGTRITVFVSGCEHKCPGCYNQYSWNAAHGIPFTEDTLQYVIDTLNDKRIKYRGLSLTGGDPLYPANLSAVYRLLRRVRRDAPHADVWLWTGYSADRLSARQRVIYRMCDYVVDGLYIQDLRTKQLAWRGSSNQRLIDVKRSISAGTIILAEFDR